MQEIKKRRIVIASVLKPVDDTRMFEKLGKSLSDQYAVHIAGYPGAKPLPDSTIRRHPHDGFNRLSFRRMLVPWKIFALVWRFKPALLIITTHELLPMAMLSKLFLGCKIVYDIQENYYRNIRHTNTFPSFLRPLLAGYVRWIENITSPWVDHFLLAEKGYEEELQFPGKRYLTLENKFRRPGFSFTRKPVNEGKIHLLFSGTLAESTGVFTAIDLATQLHAEEPRIQLLIIGYCAHTPTLLRVQEEIADKSFITLAGGKALVAHEEILRAIQQADFGIVAYPPNPATTNSLPTKLYEYLGSRLPILLINHYKWVNFCAPYHAALVFSPDDANISHLLKAMKTDTFYTADPEGIFWEDEEIKLKNLIFKLLE